MKRKKKLNSEGLKGPEWDGKDETSSFVSAVEGTPDELRRAYGSVTLPARTVPVVFDGDVAVVGAGVAGIIAAVAAARYGARTALIEGFSSLGGNMGPGMFAGGSLHLALNNPEAFPNGLGGIPAEFNNRIVEGENRNVGSAVLHDEPRKEVPGSSFQSINRDAYLRDSQAVSYTALKMMEEEGVRVFLSCHATDPIMDGKKVRGVAVETKSGPLAVRSRVVIDCTGTADIAERAGAPIKTMPANPSGGVYFCVAGIDWKSFDGAKTEYGDMPEEDKIWLSENAPGWDKLMPWVRRAAEKGEFEPVGVVDDFATLEVTVLHPRVDTAPGILRGRTRINGNFDPGDALAISRIDEIMRIYLVDFTSFLKKSVPGFEKAYLLLVSDFTHFRGGKSIDSVQTVGPNEVTGSARFDDVIYIYWDDKNRFSGGTDIPYRMLLPKDVEGLLAAGKSAVQRGPQIRQRHSLQLMGQAAGVAAALAVKHGTEPRDIDVAELQKILHALGGELGPEERLRELNVI